jgi:hypothetical protein
MQSSKGPQGTDEPQIYTLYFSPKSIPLVAIRGYNSSPIIRPQNKKNINDRRWNGIT